MWTEYDVWFIESFFLIFDAYDMNFGIFFSRWYKVEFVIIKIQFLNVFVWFTIQFLY